MSASAASSRSLKTSIHRRETALLWSTEVASRAVVLVGSLVMRAPRLRHILLTRVSHLTLPNGTPASETPPTIGPMLGGRKKRVEKLSAGAQANLEEGESIRELVQTQTGQSAAANASAVGTSELMSSQLGIFYRANVSAGPHVLVATDRNLYAMK